MLFPGPECAVAYIDDDGDVMIISTDQSAYCTFHESSLMLGTDKVKCQNALVGGGFGGKEDMTVQASCCTDYLSDETSGQSPSDKSRNPC